MELIELTYKRPAKELRLEITTDTIVAEHRKLKARWTMQTMEDIELFVPRTHFDFSILDEFATKEG